MKPLFFIIILLYSCNKCYDVSNSYIQSVTLKNKHIDSMAGCTQFNYKNDTSTIPLDSLRTIFNQSKEGIELTYRNPRNTRKFKYVIRYQNSVREHTLVLQADDEDDCG